MEKVHVSKRLLIGLVAVSAGSLLAVAFLLGRSSAPSTPPEGPARAREAAAYSPETRPAGGSTLAPTPVEARGSEFVSAYPAPETTPVLPGDRGLSQGAPLAPMPSAAGDAPAMGSSPGGVDPASVAVAKYLDAVDQIQPANVSGGAESIAGEMAAALARGDTTGLDGMIRDSEAARERLAALRPPEACSTHHRETLGSLDEALEMLRSLKGAMESPDPAAALANVASRANTLRTRAEALQNEDRALRQRYGLARSLHSTP